VDASARPMAVAGGLRSLRRVLLNLLTNAKEGDGLRGAAYATVRLCGTADHQHLSIDDDGPGLRPPASKTTSIGSGLRFVRAVALGSGGDFILRGTSNGARAILRSPTYQREQATAPVTTNPTTRTAVA